MLACVSFGMSGCGVVNLFVEAVIYFTRASMCVWACVIEECISNRFSYVSVPPVL